MSGRRLYTPERGDIVITNFSPQTGQEMAGRHHCLVLSEQKFSVATGLMVGCPITSQVKGSPFEVVVPAGFKTRGCVVASEVRTQDYLARGVQFVERAPDIVLRSVQAIACAVLDCT
jgi:mRNA interferase MazF